MKKKISISINVWLSIVQYLLARFVKVNEHFISDVKGASLKGSIVFVLRNRNIIDFLALRGICRKYGLPEPGFVSGISPAVFLPLWKLVLLLIPFKNGKSMHRRLSQTLDKGGSAIIFLRRPAIGNAFGSRPAGINGLNILVESIDSLSVDVAVIPTVFLWGESPMSRPGGNFSFIFGTPEYPRLLRSLWLLIKKRSVHDV
ncbi:MAG: hypothetical protein JXR91_16865, partial [Deltaproteobacteria bacterium]|nr:hypothetical protein [Deltaproteobacteria bacterium]